MDNAVFQRCREKLGKTQKELAQILCTSLKSVHGYEQGWRKIPAHIQRLLMFLVMRKQFGRRKLKPCWEINHCPAKLRERCPANEFKAGDLCWFISGTLCDCSPHESWEAKIAICWRCKAFARIRKQLEAD
ncbi:MAG: helix-turn-helix transcriptional regulator [Desulfosarcinaceae bacterium]|nr:helix-turn-helix transcriptional regulator [Desulfosarcinaceae bacterium]